MHFDPGEGQDLPSYKKSVVILAKACLPAGRPEPPNKIRLVRRWAISKKICVQGSYRQAKFA